MTVDNVTTKRNARKKSDFYHARWNKVGINEKLAAELLYATVDDVQRWDIEGNKLAEAYLLLWDKKRLHHPDWQGWYFDRSGRLCRGGQGANVKRFTAYQLLHYRDTETQLLDLRYEIDRLQREIKRLQYFEPTVKIQIVSSIGGRV